MRLSSLIVGRSVWPAWPGRPPTRRPDGRRKLFVRPAHGGSVEGGREELCESFMTSASSSVLRRRSQSTSPRASRSAVLSREISDA